MVLLWSITNRGENYAIYTSNKGNYNIIDYRDSFTHF